MIQSIILSDMMLGGVKNQNWHFCQLAATSPYILLVNCLHNILTQQFGLSTYILGAFHCCTHLFNDFTTYLQ
jgi:hypothetical protein